MRLALYREPHRKITDASRKRCTKGVRYPRVYTAAERRLHRCRRTTSCLRMAQARHGYRYTILG